jgi:mono/diheme cytochrome c family protein
MAVVRAKGRTTSSQAISQVDRPGSRGQDGFIIRSEITGVSGAWTKFQLTYLTDLQSAYAIPQFTSIIRNCFARRLPTESKSDTDPRFDEMRSCSTRLLLFSILTLMLNLPVGGFAADGTGEELFESQIRPLLHDNCFMCHGPKKQKGGLRLDSRKAILQGGDSGPALTPGDPKASILVQAVHYGRGEYVGGKLEMPPDGRLSAEKIAALTRWVAIGAPWPRSPNRPTAPAGANPRAAIDSAGETHWAFQAIRRPSPPSVKNAKWIRNPIDQFVLARLEAAGIAPSRRADSRTLLRRAYLDLTGLPPSPDSTTDFLKMDPEGGFNRLIDQLLKSPNYGERWGRHWLDVARYADSKGAIFGETRQYPYAYTYRDYVIAAFNDDKPYNQFIREQLAADMLPGIALNDLRLAALGFLTVHRRSNAGGKEAQWNDRVDTVGRGLLGLTIACARCHDHKYDPISAADFYALYGIFASIEEPREFPVVSRPPAGSKLDLEFKAYLTEEDRKLQDYIDEKHRKIMDRFRGEVGRYLLVVRDGRVLEDGKFRTLAGRRKLNPHVSIRWKEYLTAHENDAVLGAWPRLAAIPDADFATVAPAVIKAIAANKLVDCNLNPLVVNAFADQQPKSIKAVADIYQELFTETDQTKESKSDRNRKQILALLYGPKAPGVMPALDFKKLDRPIFLELLKKKADRTLRLALHPGSPRRAMAVRDKEKLFASYIHIRGDKDRKGPAVERRFLERFGGNNNSPFTRGSGRLELAEAIVAPDNPLTARVIVNRIWQYHFGRGLVDDASDFGLRSPLPTHPLLLDWLASEFVTAGWSIKHLHRLIMGSATYQQASHAHAENYSTDPDNRFLWRFNRRRLEFETIRDSMLAVAGRLDPRRGGPASRLTYARGTDGLSSADWERNPYRRAVYGVLERDKMAAHLQAFDVPTADESTSQRNVTTVPTQSLFLMNAEFPMEMATTLVDRVDPAAADTATVAIRKIYQRMFNRPPTRGEIAVGLAFVIAPNEPDPPSAQPKANDSVWRFGYAPYERNDGSHGLDNLKPFPHLGRWVLQGGPKFPDKKNGFGWLQMRSTGGHAGGGNRCQVRRWTSPVSGSIKIAGTLKHGSKIGDGIRATLYLNRTQRLGQWSAKNAETDTSANLTVKKGDTIDLVVDCIQEGSYDGFNWNPVISSTKMSAKRRDKWSPKMDFPKPPVVAQQAAVDTGPWTQYVHTLLMSNEFVYLE